MKNIFLKIILLFLFHHSCSQMRSGKYIYLEDSSSLKKISKQYELSLQEIKRHNPGRSIAVGEWIFVPTSRGIKYFFEQTEEISKYSVLGAERFYWPVPSHYRISSRFGKRGRKHHDGIDIPAPSGTPIVASESGRVIYSGSGIRGYGNLIVLSHEGDIFTVYAHNRKNNVKKGQKVKRGQKIAEVGNTGRSTGPHLHFEIRIKNTVANPMGYLSKR